MSTWATGKQAKKSWAAETSIISKPRKLRNHLSFAGAGEVDQLETETEQTESIAKAQS